jgi:hypothetical protein
MKSMRILGLALMMLMAGSTQAQTVKETADSVKAGVKSGNVKDAYSKISESFKTKKEHADTLIGTWAYKEPAIYATKGNVLLKFAENAVANQLEKLLQDYIDKSNITSENTHFTFYKDSHFDRVIAGHAKRGLWLLNGDKLIMGMDCIVTAEVTLHHEKDAMMMLIDVDKLLTGLKALGAMKDTKANKRLIKMSKRIPGLQAGISVVKKQ